MSRTLQSYGALALATLILASCAARGSSVGEGQSGTIVVDNSNSRIDQVIVYLVPDGGSRQHLGTVTRGQEKRFPFRGTAGRRYMLVADVGVEQIVSESFLFMEGDVVEWDLQVNQLLRQEAASP